jgi:hypothetical protein
MFGASARKGIAASSKSGFTRNNAWNSILPGATSETSMTWNGIAANVFHLIEKLRERRGRENTAMDVTVGEPRLLARHLKCLQKRPRPLSQTLGQNLRVPGLITNERGPLPMASAIASSVTLSREMMLLATRPRSLPKQEFDCRDF